MHIQGAFNGLLLLNDQLTILITYHRIPEVPEAAAVAGLTVYSLRFRV